MLYGVALVQELQRSGVKGRLSVAPTQVDGVWYLELTYAGEAPGGVPELWYGHRVVVLSGERPGA